MEAGLEDFSLEVIFISEVLIVFLGYLLEVKLLLEVELELRVFLAQVVDDMEGLVEVSGDEEVGVRTGGDGELIEDAFVLIQFTQFRLQWFEDGNRRDRFRSHVQIPDLHREEVPAEDIATVLREGRIGDR